jgi:hypothetical protein
MTFMTGTDYPSNGVTTQNMFVTALAAIKRPTTPDLYEVSHTNSQNTVILIPVQDYRTDKTQEGVYTALAICEIDGVQHTYTHSFATTQDDVASWIDDYRKYNPLKSVIEHVDGPKKAIQNFMEKQFKSDYWAVGNDPPEIQIAVAFKPRGKITTLFDKLRGKKLPKDVASLYLFIQRSSGEIQQHIGQEIKKSRLEGALMIMSPDERKRIREQANIWDNMALFYRKFLASPEDHARIWNKYQDYLAEQGHPPATIVVQDKKMLNLEIDNAKEKMNGIFEELLAERHSSSAPPSGA